MELLLLALAAGAAWISYRAGLDAGRTGLLNAQRLTIESALSTPNDFYRKLGLRGCYLLDGHEYSSPAGFVVVSLSDLQRRLHAEFDDIEEPTQFRRNESEPITEKQSGTVEPRLVPSQKLSGIVGTSPLTATEATKRVWEYIVKNQLQESENSTSVRCDAALVELTGKERVSLFELTKTIRSNLANSEA